MTRFPEAFANSVIITVISNLIIAMLSAMAAYRWFDQYEIQSNRVHAVRIGDGHSVPIHYDSIAGH